MPISGRACADVNPARNKPPAKAQSPTTFWCPPLSFDTPVCHHVLQVPQRVLLLVGNQDAMIPSGQEGPRLRRALPRCRLVNLRGRSHAMLQVRRFPDHDAAASRVFQILQPMVLQAFHSAHTHTPHLSHFFCLSLCSSTPALLCLSNALPLLGLLAGLHVLHAAHELKARLIDISHLYDSAGRPGI